MANGVIENPFGSLIGQINQLAQARQSPEAAKLAFDFQQRIADQTKQNLANQYLATADFSKDPSGALRTFGAILGNNDIIKASLDMSLKQRELDLHRDRLQKEIEKQQFEMGVRANLGESLATGTEEDIARAAGLSGESGLIQNVAKSKLLTPEEEQLQQQKIRQGGLEALQTKAITSKIGAEEEALRKRTAEEPEARPLTPTQKLTQTRMLKQELEKSKSVQEFKTIRRQVTNVNKALADVKNQLTRGIKQEVAIVSFQKILDPISVVRESEFARTVQGQGFLQRIDTAINRALKGGFVTGETVESIQSLVNDLAANAQKFANAEVNSRRELGSSFGLDPDLIGKPFIDFEEPDSATVPNQNAPATGQSRFESYIKSNEL